MKQAVLTAAILIEYYWFTGGWPHGPWQWLGLAIGLLLGYAAEASGVRTWKRWRRRRAS